MDTQYAHWETLTPVEIKEEAINTRTAAWREGNKEARAKFVRKYVSRAGEGRKQAKKGLDRFWGQFDSDRVVGKRTVATIRKRIESKLESCGDRQIRNFLSTVGDKAFFDRIIEEKGETNFREFAKKGSVPYLGGKDLPRTPAKVPGAFLKGDRQVIRRHMGAGGCQVDAAGPPFYGPRIGPGKESILSATITKAWSITNILGRRVPTAEAITEEVMAAGLLDPWREVLFCARPDHLFVGIGKEGADFSVAHQRAGFRDRRQEKEAFRSRSGDKQDEDWDFVPATPPGKLIQAKRKLLWIRDRWMKTKSASDYRAFLAAANRGREAIRAAAFGHPARSYARRMAVRIGDYLDDPRPEPIFFRVICRDLTEAMLALGLEAPSVAGTGQVAEETPGPTDLYSYLLARAGDLSLRADSFWGNRTGLAKVFGISPAKVSGWMRRLEKEGLIFRPESESGRHSTGGLWQLGLLVCLRPV